MASVIAEARGKRTRYRIQFLDGDKRRRSIRLSGLGKKDAESIASRIDALNSARISGRSWEPSLAAWVASLGQEMADKLAGAGLIHRRGSATLRAFLEEYARLRSEVAETTQNSWKAARQKLIAFFGEERNLRDISPGEADDWRQQLVSRGYSQAVVSKSVKNARQFFKYAVRKRLCDINPFLDLKAGGEANPERKVFVPRETIAKVLDACPDAEWRAIVALARYGGLRVPSELLKLEWGHIDWEHERFTVTSDKTKGLGKGWRVVPLFPELREYLGEAQETAPEGAVFVVSRYRQANVNLRQQLMRIIRRAGATPWTRLFHNLRASRQTELANQFPGHVVCQWLGNTEAIAAKHYLTVTEEHFQQAAGVVHKVVQQRPETSGNEHHPLHHFVENPRENLKNKAIPEDYEYARRDSKTPAIPAGKPQSLPKGGAQGGAFADALFSRLVELWPSLGITTRRELVAMAEAAASPQASVSPTAEQAQAPAGRPRKPR